MQDKLLLCGSSIQFNSIQSLYNSSNQPHTSTSVGIYKGPLICNNTSYLISKSYVCMCKIKENINCSCKKYCKMKKNNQFLTVVCDFPPLTKKDALSSYKDTTLEREGDSLSETEATKQEMPFFKIWKRQPGFMISPSILL